MCDEYIDEVEIVERAKTGDADSFSRLVARYRPMAMSMAVDCVGDRAVADEIVQEAFLKAYVSIRSYSRRDGARFSTWLCVIVKHLSIDHLRRRQRRKTFSLNDQYSEPTDGVTAQTLLEIKEEDELFQAAINALSPVLKETLLLRCENLSYDQIAERMDIPAGTVMSRLYYARQKLQAILAKK